MLKFPAGRIESKDVDLTIKLDKAYKDLESYKKLPLKGLEMVQLLLFLMLPKLS